MTVLLLVILVKFEEGGTGKGFKRFALRAHVVHIRRYKPIRTSLLHSTTSRSSLPTPISSGSLGELKEPTLADYML